MHQSAPRADDGFTLIEVLVAMAVVLVGVAATLTVVDRANQTTVTTRTRESATNLAREVIEVARGLEFAAVSPASLPTELAAAQPGLADEAPTEPGWQLRRRGTVYTLTPSVCVVDDGRDGGGTHAAGGFCPESVAENAADPRVGPQAHPDGTPKPGDTAPEDYKRVVVTVAWTHRGHARAVTQSTLINNPGSAGGPAIQAIDAPALGAAKVLTDGNATRIDFTVALSSAPQTLHWLLDGIVQGAVTGGDGTSRSFTWDLGVPGQPGSVGDGVYLVAAEAFNVYGVAGPSRSVTITLNRSAPTPPSGVAGGRGPAPADPTREVVNLEWLPNADGDLHGYRVFRVEPDGARVEVCGLALATECRDEAPPARPDVSYVVVAYDTDPVTGAERASADSDLLTVTSGNRPPAAPVGLRVVGATGDVTTLEWTRPDDPDGDDIDFYRVYRDGEAVGDRYFRVDDAGGSVRFEDAATNGEPHSYRVSAVDERYSESALAGPVGA